MATIHLIGGEKGGVGKSVVARLLAQYMIDHELPFVGFDTDKSHGSLLRFYSDYASPTIIDSYRSLDAIMEVAAEQPHHRYLLLFIICISPTVIKYILNTIDFDTVYV